MFDPGRGVADHGMDEGQGIMKDVICLILLAIFGSIAVFFALNTYPD